MTLGEGITAGIEIPEKDSPGTDTRTSSSAKRTRARKGDRPPKKQAAKPALSSDLTTQQIEDALAEILTFPAVPCAMAGDEWAANHFTTNGRVFAQNLASASERNPTLRKWCERAVLGEGMFMLGMSGCMYLLPPLIHWGVIPMPNQAKEMIGIPVKEPVTDDGSTAAQAMADVPVTNNNGSTGTHVGA